MNIFEQGLERTEGVIITSIIKRYGYLKISDRSGCISENYKVKGKESEMVIIPVEEREISGRFKPYNN